MLHPSLILLAWPALFASQDPATEVPRYFPRSTVKISQLISDVDKTRRVATRSLTESRAGLVATDLGSSFEHKGKLWFLFGDCRGREGNRDAMAWTDAKTPETLELHVPLAKDGLFRPIDIPGVKMGAYEVPSHGISIGGVMYVVTTAGHERDKVMKRSLLVRSTDEGENFQILHELSNDAFVNVAMVRASREAHAALPVEDAVLIWGSGDYRRSSPRLAYTPPKQLGRKQALRYFAGMGDEGPLWSAEESQAIALFDEPVVGELSVSWIEPLERWVMIYKGQRPTGIVMRSAEHPWGPWSEAEEIFNRWDDMGYANFMHVAWGSERMDSFHDKGRENRWGGAGSTYLIDRFTKGDETRCTIYYTMSTWNPYTVVLMSTDIGYPDRAAPLEVEEELTLPDDDTWSGSTDSLRRFDRAGVRHVSTRDNFRDVDVAVVHRPIEPTLDGSLEFTLNGGEAELVLIRESKAPPRKIEDFKGFHRRLKRGDFGEVVEAIAGPNNEKADVQVRWNLSRHVGHPLRLYLVDSLRGKWGYVNVSEMKLRSTRPAEE